MKTVKLGFTLTLSPLMEQVESFQIGTYDIKSNLPDYKTETPDVYGGEIGSLMVIRNVLDVYFIITGIPGQQCMLSILVNDKPLPSGNIVAVAGNNHRAVCNNNKGQGYALPL